MVTVNDYLAKRDSEWMGPLYMFHGLSVDCIDKHRPNSEERRRAYQADITFGTNNEFGFDYLRDNMAMQPEDLVQRKHNYAIVDEVDSVLIDDARTPLIISGADAKQMIAKGQETDDKQMTADGFLSLYRSYKALPKNTPLVKYLSEDGIKSGMLNTEEIYMENNNRKMPEAIAPLYFVIDEKLNTVTLTDKGSEQLAQAYNDPAFFIIPDVCQFFGVFSAKLCFIYYQRPCGSSYFISFSACCDRPFHIIAPFSGMKKPLSGEGGQSLNKSLS